MTKFRDLQIGDTFWFIGDRTLNSFYARCVKLSERTYTEEHRKNALTPMRVGSINAKVYHVKEAQTD